MTLSLPIHVDAYSGFKANERPQQFCIDEDMVERSSSHGHPLREEELLVAAIVGRWLLKCWCHSRLQIRVGSTMRPSTGVSGAFTTCTRSGRRTSMIISGCSVVRN